ncbi:MAG: hypothetical protein COV44_07160 [Deltaproteobacteria bacterium CG11_big_fil_rev_8_21_14_0_20_45_16]|nr:MAG: hypothetical protein COV44_07160 [Deltaproteobacteria bacterium CG11_big_fil_rev_8_21_14_0_20_45_16]
MFNLLDSDFVTAVIWGLIFCVAILFGLSVFFRNRFHKKSKELQELINKRTDFVANVSHELKTPLTSIRGYTETLRAGAYRDLEKAASFLEKIEDNVQRLDALIHDILDLSQLEATDAFLHFEDIEMDRLFHHFKEQFRFRLEAKNQTLSMDSSVKLLRADKNLVEQAVSNLIGNANRYCPEGSQIQIKCAPIHLEQKDWIRIDVIDNGPGIVETDLTRIFERFYRADKSRNRAFGGTGLGLAIVKHIMLSHKGKALASNNADRGMHFSLLFPASPGR